MVFWESQIYNQSEVFGWEKFVEKQGNQKGKKDALLTTFYSPQFNTQDNKDIKKKGSFLFDLDVVMC